MDFVNSRLKRVKPSETLAVKARAAELIAQGRSIIDLSTGEPDIDTPQHIKDAASDALKRGKTKYTAVPGIPELRSAIAKKLTDENGLHVDANSVIVTNGGKQAIYSFFDCVLEPGDEVVIIAPYWVSYPAMVELCGGKPVVVTTRAEDGFKISPQALAGVMTSRTRCVIVNSPSNPTGVTYSKQELAALGAVIATSNALILSDEVYEKIVFGDFQFSSFVQACPALESRTVTVNAFSKSYSMTGWRVGYAAGPKEIIAAMGRHQSQTTSNVCTASQYGALAALNGSHDFIKAMLINFERRFAVAIETLNTTPGLRIHRRPEGAFYLFVDASRFFADKLVPGVNNSAGLANYLLEAAGVAVVPGEAFGDDRSFRISVAASDENVREGVRRIQSVLREGSK